ncbi:hypothetical protein NDA16_003926 [Ustilago loliicola]|nr:hypothetical protein NDA16_003926 [Ustilago loliicola]
MSYYYVDIGYVLWGFWALLFLFFYVPASGVLVYLLYRQVRRQKISLLSYQRKLEIQLAQEHRETQVSVLTGEKAGQQADHTAGRLAPAHDSRGGWSAANATPRLGAPLEDIYEDRGASDGSEGTGHSGATASFKGSQELVGLESALRHDPPSSHQVHGALTPGRTSRMGHVANLAEEAENSGSSNGPGTGSTLVTPTTPNTPRPPLAFRKLMRMETGSSSQRGGLLSPRTAKGKRISITGGPMSRYKYLRRCLVNLLILYIGIISAATCFGAITIYLAAVEYERALQGPDTVAYSIAVAGTTAAWASAVFGALTIGSIVFRNFDNPQPEASQNSGGEGGGGGGLRRRFHRNASRTLDSGSAAGAEQKAAARNPVMQEKTRTLPAVPESVDLEASMMSVVQSRPQIAMNTAMKFDMAEQSMPGGGFVIRPDDQLTSMMSTAGNTPETEEAPRLGGKQARGQALRPPPKARAWLSREREATMSIPQDVTESFGLTSVPMMVGRSNQASVEREALEDPTGHFKTTDSTLAEYPSFDPRILKGAQEASASHDTAAVRSRDAKPTATEMSPSSPVLKRHSRLSDSVGSETPASRIAREWAQSQYLAAPLPETPAVAGAPRGDVETVDSPKESEGAWISDLAGSPPASPPSSPPRPNRDLRRLLRDAESQRRDIPSPDARF